MTLQLFTLPPVSAESLELIGWTVIHSVWQIALITIAAAILIRVLARYSAERRYALLCGAMSLTVIVPIATAVTSWQVMRSVSALETTGFGFDSSTVADAEGRNLLPRTQLIDVRHLDDSARNDSVDSETAEADQAAVAGIRASYQQEILDPAIRFLQTAAPWIAGLWFAGALVLSVRQLAGWSWLSFCVRSRTHTAGDRIETLLADTMSQLGIERAIRICEASFIRVPAVVGWWRPVILLPAEVISGLQLEHLAAVIAHELAHVRRFDCLINVLQTVTETVLFYHPGVWWLSRRLRIEREHCVDDNVVRTCGDRIAYAKALAAVAEICPAGTRILVAADGGNLKSRIVRILNGGESEDQRSFAWGWVPFLATILLLGGLSARNVASDGDAESGAVADASSGTTDAKADEAANPNAPNLVARLGSGGWRHQLGILRATWSGDGKFIATSEQDGDIRLWNAETGEVVRRISPGVRVSAWGMAFSPNSKYIAYVTSAGELWRFHVDGEKPALKNQIMQAQGNGQPGGGVTWSPDGKWIAVKAANTLQILPSDGIDALIKRDSPAGIHDHAPISWSDDGRLLAVTEGTGVRVFNAESLINDEGDPTSVLLKDAHTTYVSGVDFGERKGQSVIVTGGRGVVREVRRNRSVTSACGEVKIWNPETGELIQSLISKKEYDNGTAGLVVMPGRKRVAVVDVMRVRIWNLANGKIAKTIDTGFNEKGDMWMNAVAVSPDGKLVASQANGNRLGFWSTETTAQRTDEGSIHSAKVSHVAVSRNGSVVASASSDGTIGVWSSDGWKLNRHLKMLSKRGNGEGRLSSMALSGNGRILSAGTGYRLGRGRGKGLDYIGELQFWTLASKAPAIRMNVDIVPGAMALSSDGTMLAVGSNNQAWLMNLGAGNNQPKEEDLRETIQLIDVASGKVIRKLKGHLGTIATLQFTAGSGLLLSAGADGLARAWNTESGKTTWEHKLGNTKPATAAVNSRAEFLASTGLFGESVRVTWMPGKTSVDIPLKNVKGAKLAFSPHGRVLATAGQILTSTTQEFDESLHLHDSLTAASLGRLPMTDGSVTAMAFSNDGTHLVAGTGRGVVQVWDVRKLLDDRRKARDKRRKVEQSRTQAAAANDPAQSVNESSQPATAAEKPKNSADDDGVTKAISRAVEWLKKRQQADGSYKDGGSGAHRNGATSLVTLALLRAGVGRDDPAIKKSLELLRKHDSRMTYETSLESRVWLHLGTEDDLVQARKLIEKISSSQVPSGPAIGQWRYVVGGQRLADGDLSNSKFAVMALHEAQQRGIEIPKEVWERNLQAMLHTQRDDGGWGYISRGSQPTGSMTCAGLNMLIRSSSQFDSSEFEKQIKESRETGLKWLVKHFSVAANPNSKAWHLYYLMSLREMADGLKIKQIGKHDWYINGSEYLLTTQSAEGSWTAKGTPTSPEISTAFALYFLGRNGIAKFEKTP